MSRISRSSIQNSRVVTALTAVVDRVREVSSEARTVTIGKRLLGEDSDSRTTERSPNQRTHQPEKGVDEWDWGPDVEDDSGETQLADVFSSTNDEGGKEKSNNDPGRSVTGSQTGNVSTNNRTSKSSAEPVEGSVIYRLVRAGQRLFRRSWLYGWATAEPKVIVVNIPGAYTIRPVLDWVDRSLLQLRRDIVPATSTASVTRFGYWVRGMLVARPIRILSVVMAGIANLGLLFVLSDGGEPLRPMTFVLLGVLLLAARGFRSTASWDELVESK